MTATRRSRISAVAASVLVSLTGLVVTGPPAQAAVRVKIVQHNVQKKLSVVQTAITKARSVDADGLTLQEVCASFVPTLLGIPGATVNWSSSKVDGCATGDDVGVAAVWLKGTGGEKMDPIPITDDPGRDPELVCVRYGSAPKRTICSVHLVSEDTTNVRGQQTQDIKTITDVWIGNGHAVVVAGDFNAYPAKPEMDKMYATGGVGKFNEADQTPTARVGPATDWTATDKFGNQRKIDYVFFSKNRTSTSQVAGIETFATDSDHEMVFAKADVALG